MLKDIDWSIVSFVGITMIKEYWVYYRLPHVQYWSMQVKIEDRK
ncbi:hypothetical protein [Alkalibacillus silvisoli]|uniref:YqzL family protein n=1 Tax=Alkalibacillus silvisoli TaxID=392823 RepID=A0ABP3JDD7_9BACI